MAEKLKQESSVNGQGQKGMGCIDAAWTPGSDGKAHRNRLGERTLERSGLGGIGIVLQGDYHMPMLGLLKSNHL